MKEEHGGSKVRERLAFLEGAHVKVRAAYGDAAQSGAEQFSAVYRDTVPLGREYFFVFEVAGKRRLVRTSSVHEICEG